MTGKVALYLDFENLAIPAQDRYPSLEKPLNAGGVLDYAKGHGDVLIRRAYADWSRKPCSLYVQDLMELAFDLVYIPYLTKNGKNAADLRMAMDALDDLQSSDYIDSFIIGSGDTDFIHLIRKLQQRGKRVAVVGFKDYVGRIVQLNCNEFKSVEELMGDLPKKVETEKAKAEVSGEVDGDDNGRELIIRYIKINDVRKPVHLSTMKSGMQRLDPSFSERNYGFNSFKDYVTSLVGDVVVKIDEDYQTGHPLAVLKSIDDIVSGINPDEVKRFMQEHLTYQPDSELRRRLYQEILAIFNERGQASINDVIGALTKRGIALESQAMRNFLYALGEGRLIIFAEGAKRKRNINTVPQVLIKPTPLVEDIDRTYKQRVVDLIMKKFPGVTVDRAVRFLDETLTD